MDKETLWRAMKSPIDKGCATCQYSSGLSCNEPEFRKLATRTCNFNTPEGLTFPKWKWDERV